MFVRLCMCVYCLWAGPVGHVECQKKFQHVRLDHVSAIAMFSKSLA